MAEHALQCLAGRYPTGWFGMEMEVGRVRGSFEQVGTSIQMSLLTADVG